MKETNSDTSQPSGLDAAIDNPFRTPQAPLHEVVHIVTPVHETHLNPWWSMWIYPRATTRQILNSGRRRMVPVFAAIYGVSFMLDHASRRGVPQTIPFWAILILALFLGPWIGLVLVYVGGAVVGAIGRRLGGVGTRQEVQTALAWSLLPNIEMLLLWIPEFALMGRESFRNETPALEAWLDTQPFVALPIALLYMAVFLTASMWTFVIRLKCIAEAHQFSAWRALASLLVLILPFLFLFIISLCSGALTALQEPM